MRTRQAGRTCPRRIQCNAITGGRRRFVQKTKRDFRRVSWTCRKSLYRAHGNGTPRGTSETTYKILRSAIDSPRPPRYRLPEIKTGCAASGENDIAAPFKRTVLALFELARKNKKAFKSSSLALETPFFVLYCDIMRASGNLLYRRHCHLIQIFSATWGDAVNLPRAATHVNIAYPWERRLRKIWF